MSRSRKRSPWQRGQPLSQSIFSPSPQLWSVPVLTHLARSVPSAKPRGMVAWFLLDSGLGQSNLKTGSCRNWAISNTNLQIRNLFGLNATDGSEGGRADGLATPGGIVGDSTEEIPMVRSRAEPYA